MEPQTIATARIQKRIWFAFATAALLAVSALAVVPQPVQARVFISVNIAPPLLPIYDQPPIPGPRYIWAPGYWAYDYGFGYYWVPGTWVLAPYTGALWTPGYWGWGNNAYIFYPGYWGLSVGYYGGIDYGFGYTGMGYYGGYWTGDTFFYNSTVNNITNVNITNVYNTPVPTSPTVTRASFNGPGGVTRQATAAELAAAQQRHTGPISAQLRQQSLARQNPALRASVNHGTPPILATPRAGVFQRAAATSAGAAAIRATRLGQPATTRTSPMRTQTITPRQHTLRTTTRSTTLGDRTTSRSTMLRNRTTSTRMHRESIANPPVVRHREPVIRADRSRLNNRPEPRMRNPSRVERSAGPMPAMRPAGPRPDPGMRTQGPRQAPAPRGERHPPSDKPKDHNRGD